MNTQARRDIVVRHGAREIRINTAHCAWCTDKAVCSVCHAKAEKARAFLKGKRS